jgi:hypothetical protein
MKNAYLRFGWLTYVKSTEKTTTSIKLRLDRFIGEVLPDPPRQAKAHLISVVGGDTQISAISISVLINETLATANLTNVAVTGTPGELERIVAKYPGDSSYSSSKSKPVVVTAH